MKVSTIVAAHKAGEHSRSALDRAVIQKCPEHEIVVINDGSTDRSVGCMTDLLDRRP
jgi:glycosyltransferase involved in cell wall biosynthesis